jgi:hypothetical protein
MRYILMSLHYNIYSIHVLVLYVSVLQEYPQGRIKN